MQEKVYTKEMDRLEWLRARRSSIGGSDVGTILGFNKYQSPYQLWLDKTGQIDIDTTDPSEAAYWGNVFEQKVAEEFSLRTGKKVRNDNFMYFHKDHPFLSANVDRQVVGEQAILECKTASVYLADRWEGDSIPEQYIFQVQHYLNVLNKEYAYIAVLIGGQKFTWKRVERDQELIDIIQERLIAFWNENVLGNVAPPIDGSDATTEFLKTRYANSEARKEITLGKNIDELIVALQVQKDAKKTIDTAINEIENQLKISLGEQEAEIGITPRHIVQWKPIVSNRLDSKLLKAEHPDLYEKYSKESSYKKLIIKEIK